MSKTDKDLGKKIQEELLHQGIETPIKENSNFEHQYKIDQIKQHHRIIMELLGLDLKDDSLADTPLRVAKMFVNELFYGLDYANFPKCTTVENKLGNFSAPVKINKIPVVSVCEHHFQSIIGTCDIEYTPSNNILGLSKFNRVVDFFSRRPQIQERLTAQIGVALEYILGTNVSVTIKATHNCVRCRGVQQDGCETETSYN